MPDEQLSLAEGMRQLRMTDEELWFRCLTLDDFLSIDDIRQHLHSDECPDDHEHNIIAQALNDAFVEQGGNRPVTYQHLRLPDQP